MNIEYKSQRPESMKLDDQGYFEAAFAQLGVVDLQGDITVAGAFSTKEVPVSAFGHSSWEGAPPVGRGTVSEQGDWAVFKGSFFMDSTHGRDAYITLKGLGDLAEFSYGFDLLDSGPAMHGGKSVRELRKLDVLEVSNVLRGAGLDTHLIAIKSDAPGKDAPFAEHLSWYVDGLSALIERTQDRDAFRKAEGRTLSQKDIDGLAELRTKLLAHAGAIEPFLPHEADEADELARRSLMVEIERARALGVPF